VGVVCGVVRLPACLRHVTFCSGGGGCQGWEKILPEAEQSTTAQQHNNNNA